jgi:hypothetical protein
MSPNKSAVQGTLRFRNTTPQSVLYNGQFPPLRVTSSEDSEVSKYRPTPQPVLYSGQF